MNSTTYVSDRPLVSVVIPAYNNELHIGEAIDSVLAQDYEPIEIIVVDDGSTDGTPDVVSAYGKRVISLRQENQGSAVARNLGVKSANGQYIAFLDADDTWWRHKLSYQISELVGSGYRMAYSRFIWWEPDAAGRYSVADAELELANNPRLSSAVLASGWIYADLLLDCIVWTSTVIAEKSLLEETGLFDPELRQGQDYDLWLRLSRICPMLGLERPTALYRRHSASITGSVKPINYPYLILSRSLRRWGDASPDGRQPAQVLLTARLYKSCFDHGYAHLKNGDPKVAMKSLAESTKYSGLRLKTLVLMAQAFLKGIA
ncbi:glycosyltransferase family 2 protein [Methylomagnum sp.]